MPDLGAQYEYSLATKAEKSPIEKLQHLDGSNRQTEPTLSQQEVQELWDFFFDRLNVRWALLQKRLHSPTYCYERSRLLYYTVLFAASCYVTKYQVYRSQLGELVHSLAFDPKELSKGAVETVQGLLYLSLWGTGLGKRSSADLPWLAICFAARCAASSDIKDYG